MRDKLTVIDNPPAMVSGQIPTAPGNGRLGSAAACGFGGSRDQRHYVGDLRSPTPFGPHNA
jgi:hypothetical protein